MAGTRSHGKSLCVQLQNEMEYGFLSDSWSNLAEGRSYKAPTENLKNNLCDTSISGAKREMEGLSLTM